MPNFLFTALSEQVEIFQKRMLVQCIYSKKNSAQFLLSVILHLLSNSCSKINIQNFPQYILESTHYIGFKVPFARQLKLVIRDHRAVTNFIKFSSARRLYMQKVAVQFKIDTVTSAGVTPYLSVCMYILGFLKYLFHKIDF